MKSLGLVGLSVDLNPVLATHDVTWANRNSFDAVASMVTSEQGVKLTRRHLPEIVIRQTQVAACYFPELQPQLFWVYWFGCGSSGCCFASPLSLSAGSASDAT